MVFRDRGNFRLGQIAGEYLKKGSKVYVEGSLQTRKWTDQSGQDRYTTEVVCNEMQMLDSRGSGQGGGAQGGNDGFNQSPAPSVAPTGAPKAAPAATAPAQDFNDFDDDIPF